MKLLSLAVGWLLFAWPAWGAQGPPTGASPPAASPADQEEKPFRDPFASDNTPAQAKAKISDPLEPMNRAFFRFNDKFYFWVLKPAAKGYSNVLPQPARVSVASFSANIKYPVRLVNNLLQGKFKSAGLETVRFVVNSTVGVAGLFDPAADWKLEAHPADFDQTLGFYGVRPGIYFDWPLLGASSARGTAGLVADAVLSPWDYIDGLDVELGVPAFDFLNTASLRLGEYESFKKATLDPYVAMRSAYFENRAAAVEKSRGKE